MSGQHLERDLVRAARKEEMDKFYEHKFYTKRPIAECIKATGKKPIGSKCTDINKGGKSSIIDQGWRRRRSRGPPCEETFAATPPLESKKCLFSLAMTLFARNRVQNFHAAQKLLFVDVRRAYFYATAKRPVYVILPEKDAEPGICGRLNVSMYGTRDAAAYSEAKYSSHLITHGFKQGKASPCVLFHPELGLRCVVHGNDLTFPGSDPQ